MDYLMEAVHKHDRTRPVTCANNSDAAKSAWSGGVADAEDLLGVNYNYQNFDILHKEFRAKWSSAARLAATASAAAFTRPTKWPPTD